MTEEQFKAFMAELAEVMEANAVQPADEPMYMAMRKWLHEKLVRREQEGYES